MSYGYDKAPRVFLGDTAQLQASLYDIDNNEVTTWNSAVVNVYDPTGTQIVTAQACDSQTDNTAFFNIAGSLITVAGQYRALATFDYTANHLLKSVPMFFEAVDPFVRADATPADPAIDLAWQKLEDCFDSEWGGPWLRDMTMANFSRDKVKDFIPDVLLEINAEMPQTEWDQNSFPYTTDDGTAIFGLGLLVATIRHLMRSYVEQPDQSSSPAPHLDRTRYQQVWASQYQFEKERYDKLLPLFKVRSFAQNGAALLVASKQGRLLPAPMRTRNVGRGYY